MKEEIRGRKNAGGKEKLEFSFFFFFLKIFFTYKCLLPMKWSNEHASNDLYFTKAISIIDESSDKKKKISERAFNTRDLLLWYIEIFLFVFLSLSLSESI